MTSPPFQFEGRTCTAIWHTDITERKRTEEILLQSQKMEAIGQLTGGIAHDFNNLLAIMIGNLSILEEEIDPDHQAAETLAPVMRAVHKAASLINYMLAFSRQQPLAPQRVDVNYLLHGMKPLIELSLAEEVEIDFDLAMGLPECEIDPGQLEQAILNISINARDAMPKGGHLRIETASVSFALDDDRPVEIAPGNYLTIAVSNDGVGIPSENLERLFDPFFSTKVVSQGTGLGLRMVYGFVKQSKGQITVTSTEGQGATFRIFLSAMETAATSLEVRAAHPIIAAKGEVILVVEDAEDVRLMVGQALEKLGYQVLLAIDGRAGLEQLARHRNIDLLLVDIMLPGGINGQQVADMARAENTGIKVLIMSGYARDAILDQGRLKTSDNLLSKPFRGAKLAEQVRDASDRE